MLFLESKLLGYIMVDSKKLKKTMMMMKKAKIILLKKRENENLSSANIKCMDKVAMKNRKKISKILWTLAFTQQKS